MDQGVIIFNMTLSDIISIVDLFFTTVVGIWIALVVQRNLTTNRAIKDYYIKEIVNIRSSYTEFLNRIYNGDASAKTIKDWMKVITNRILCIELSLNDSLIIKKNQISKKHMDIQGFITGTEEFNNEYKSRVVLFNDNTKNELLSLHTNLLKSFTEVVIEINKASGHGIGWRLRKWLKEKL